MAYINVTSLTSYHAGFVDVVKTNVTDNLAVMEPCTKTAL